MLSTQLVTPLLGRFGTVILCNQTFPTPSLFSMKKESGSYGVLFLSFAAPLAWTTCWFTHSVCLFMQALLVGLAFVRM
jgi:hypothetical protein